MPDLYNSSLERSSGFWLTGASSSAFSCHLTAEEKSPDSAQAAVSPGPAIAEVPAIGDKGLDQHAIDSPVVRANYRRAMELEYGFFDANR